MAIDDADLLDCFVNLPTEEEIPFVLDYNRVQESQLGDARLQDLMQKKPNAFSVQPLAPDTEVVCYTPEPQAPWKIYLPTSLLHDAVKWYHHALGHLGTNRLFDTMSLHLFHPDLKQTVQQTVSQCDTCQRKKQVL